MSDIIHPSLIGILLGLLIFIFYHRILNYLAIFVSVLIFLFCLNLQEGVYNYLTIFNYDFYIKVDKLSLFFCYVFSLIGMVGLLYSLHEENRLIPGPALLYMSSAIGVTLAYDLISFYAFWEMLAFTAILLIISSRTKASYFSTVRYAIIHAVSGLCLLLGMLYLSTHYDIKSVATFSDIRGTFPYYLILLAVLINAAMPPLHFWLPDSYPNATIYGSVFLSAFTTKSAVYALVRMFPGEPIISVAGALMALYGVIYATLENNPRRLLSYHIVSQVGFMVCGAGLGSQEALNGASAHAFAHIIYKGLLFMSAGAVIYSTGLERLHLLGGYARRNPWVALYFFVGALSISGLPLTSGFVSKNITIHSAADLHKPLEYLLMEVASVGTFFSIVMKMGFNIFFGEPKSNYEVKPIPWNMHAAMFIASSLCILIGILPSYYYELLPYPEHFIPYTFTNVVNSLSLFSATALIYFLVAKIIAPKPKINLDTEWFFIKLCKALVYLFNKILVPAEYRYVGEFYRFLVDKMLSEVRDVLVSMNYIYLRKVAIEFPQNVYNLSIKTANFYDGNMLKYLQFLLIFLAILLTVIILR